MNKHNKHSDVRLKMAESKARYSASVQRVLVQQFHLANKVAKDLVDHSTFLEMFEQNPAFITHYAPEHWAAELYEDYALLASQ
ncbi:MAG TPA: hypothetical protein VFV52_10615 [Bacilli bacterium]|nr:hypothetical protein [Bacilli bacterium]